MAFALTVMLRYRGQVCKLRFEEWRQSKAARSGTNLPRAVVRRPSNYLPTTDSTEPPRRYPWLWLASTIVSSVLLVCRLEVEVVICLSPPKNLRPDFASTCSRPRNALPDKPGVRPGPLGQNDLVRRTCAGEGYDVALMNARLLFRTMPLRARPEPDRDRHSDPGSARIPVEAGGSI